MAEHARQLCQVRPPPSAARAASVSDFVARLTSGADKVEDVVTEVLDNLVVRDQGVSSVLEVFRSSALQTARARDRQRSIGLSSLQRPLFGVPVLVKANIAVAGEKLSCASRFLEHYVSPFAATVVRRLDEAGAVIVGQTNMDEFAMGSSCEHSIFGPTRNPYDLKRVPGGSSGGAAAAVALGLAPLSLGSDTGGSVRQPAGFCQVYGFKPTYGAVSRYGLVAFGSSLDQIAPLARSAADLKAVIQCISGRDPRDATSIDLPPSSQRWVPHSRVAGALSGLRVGVLRRDVQESCDLVVRQTFERSVQILADHGAQVTDVSFDRSAESLAAYYVLSSAEASSNLSRFDGLKFGSRAEGESLEQVVVRSRTLGFGPEVRRRICLGTFVLSSGYYAAYYGRALLVRRLLREEFERSFHGVDLILSPTSPSEPFLIGEQIGDPTRMYANDVFTIPASLAGLPALSVPVQAVGASVTGGLGLQLVGPHGSDMWLLDLAAALEGLGWCGISPGGDL
jgi:aspartyl-tRNA(Asn)/glutamyl-tRNA(Gln) amidotransferase subunit A